MLMTAVVLPEAFAEAHFTDASYSQNAEIFLRGCYSNGLILVDSDNRLYGELCDSVERLAGLPKGRTTHILFVELLKRHRQKMQRFLPTDRTVGRSCTAREAVAQVVSECSPDILLVDPESDTTLMRSIPEGTEVVAVPDYIGSTVESGRWSYTEQLPPSDQMPDGMFQELITRCTRFSRWLRFYDKQIGKGNNLSHFRRGIERLLELWTTTAYFPKSQLHVEIFTVADESPRCQFPPSVAFDRVKKDLIDVLSAKLGVRIDLRLKRDSNHIAHARHLQTQSVAILFDAGFDFLNEDGTFRRNFLRLDGACLNHLKEYRDLPDFLSDE